MDARMLFLTFIALDITATVAVPAAAPVSDNFEDAIKLVEVYKQTLPSDTFCNPLDKGGFVKYACRIISLPIFGFLYRKKEGDEPIRSCENLIRIELQSLKDLDKAGLRTIGFHPTMITGVLCSDTKSHLCAGLIVKWVDKSKGKFVKFTDQLEHLSSISQSMIRWTKPREGLHDTIKDLQNIATYMHPILGKPDHYYKQIGDLQGFYLLSGGFLVSDPSEIEQTDTEDVKRRFEVLKCLIETLTVAAPSIKII